MPKRSKEQDKEDKIKRKIQKLQRKLEKRRRSPSTSPEPPLELPVESVNEEIEECVANDLPTPDEDIGGNITPELGELVLSALGQASSSEKMYGENIHPEIIKRIENILTTGMKKEAKEELIKKILIPNNGKLLDAPKLNIELQGLLSDAIKSRDKRVEDRQQQLGTAIAAVLSVLHMIINDDFNKLKTIGTLSDVARLLSDFHCEDTSTRRKLIAPNLDKNIAKSVENMNRDSFLFGEKFNETAKTASAIKKSASSILKPISQKTSNRPQQSLKKQGNYRCPPRPSQYKQGGGGRYQQRTSVRPQQRHPPTSKSYPLQKPVRQT